MKHPRAFQDVLASFCHQFPRNQGRTSRFLSPGQAVTVTRVTAGAVTSCPSLLLPPQQEQPLPSQISTTEQPNFPGAPKNQRLGTHFSLSSASCSQPGSGSSDSCSAAPRSGNHPQGDPFSFLESLITPERIPGKEGEPEPLHEPGTASTGSIWLWKKPLENAQEFLH